MNIPDKYHPSPGKIAYHKLADDLLLEFKYGQNHPIHTAHLAMALEQGLRKIDPGTRELEYLISLFNLED